MLDHLEFISQKKSLLIAPAGYGKTHTIAECLNHTQDLGKQLILTHTHAGVASLKEKINKNGIPSSSYHVETISSFAQKYVLAFYTGKDIPSQEDSKLYYPFLLEKAILIFEQDLIKKIILKTYVGLFVDEYQDCTIKQHELILLLSEIIPTHIIGDFLQGIFDFDGERLVDLNSSKDMQDFILSKYELDKPQRWIKSKNTKLGIDLSNVREKLIKKEEIDLTKYTSIERYIISETDLFNPTKIYNKKLRSLLSENSVLLLHSDSSSIHPRKKIIGIFNNRFTLVEAIDDKEFYKLSKVADLINKEDISNQIASLSKSLFNKTGFDNWFNVKGFKSKKKPKDKVLVYAIELKIKILENKISFSLVSEILKDIHKLPEIKCYRKELLNTFCKALEEAESLSTSVYESMVNKRNLIRKIGRKIYGKCIGTTLLTKGLEFDTVAIINAHKFECPKHLYVAMTRASKRLIIFTNNSTLKPKY